MKHTTELIGYWMIIMWFAILGVGGFVTLLGVAYALTTGLDSLLRICLFFLAAPFLLTMGFGAMFLVEHSAAILKDSDLAKSWWETKPSHVILYKTFFL